MNNTKTQKPLPVVAAIILNKENKILIAQRLPTCNTSPNKWEFPGGKIEFKEHPKDTIIREIREEIDIEIKPIKLFQVDSHIYKRQDKELHILLITYICKYISGTIKPLECQNVKWINYKELYKYKFADGDEKLVENFTKSYQKIIQKIKWD